MLKDVIRNILYTILLPIVPLFFGLFTVVVSADSPTIELLTERILVSLEFIILSIVLGLIAGILLGILSVKVRYKFVKVFIQILIILGISMPMFFVGMWFQYILAYQLGLFPAIGDPTLPSVILFLLTLFLTTRQVRSNYLKKSVEKHILSNSLQIILNLSVLIISILLLEVTFGFHGFFDLFISAIYLADGLLLRVCVFILIILSAIILLLSNLGFTIYNFISEKRQSQNFTKIFGRSERMLEEGARYTLDSDQKFKDFIVYRLLSPLTIIGIVVVVLTTIVAVFPQILTPFTLEEATDIYLGAWEPPSATHPLGQANFGRDVLALLAYGVSTMMKVCILPVLIGIAIGTLFGYLSKVHRWVKGLVLGLMVILFIVPSIIVILIFIEILGRNITVTMSIMAMYMIPWVTLIISKGNYSLKLTVKKLIVYFPLFMAFNILLFEAIGFLGFFDPSLVVQLGNNIYYARNYIFNAPWASLWSGLAIFAAVVGFLTLHYGLKEPIPIIINRE